MKNKYLCFYLLITLEISWIVSFAQVIVPQWALQIGGAGDDRGLKLITDPSGNIYFTGIIEQEVNVISNGISDTISCKGKEDIWFGKVNSEGYLLWSKHIGGKSSDSPTDLMITSSGEVYLSGVFEDTLYFESDTLISGDYIDSFIAKFDSLGNNIWLQQISGLGNQQCVSLLSDLEGNLLTGGNFTKTIELPGTSSEILFSTGGFDGFFAKWTSSGELSWIRLIQGTGKTLIKDLIIDEYNDYYITGDFSDSISVEGSSPITYSVGNTDVFLIKYLNSGSFSWIKSVGSIYDDKAKCLTIGGNEKIIMIGEFKENLIYSNHVLLSAEGGDDIFQITFNKNGNVQNHKKQGLEKNDFVFDAWIPIGQKVLMASDLRINEGNENTILASYGLLGDISDVYQTGMDLNPTVLSALMKNEDIIYYCGNFHGTVNLDQLTLTSAGSEDMFLIKMAPEDVMLNAYQPDSVINESVTLNIGDSHSDGITNVFLDPDVTEVQTEIFYNYPNPFQNKTQIIYTLPETCIVNLIISDAQGKVLNEWDYTALSSGEHVQTFGSEELNSGIYTCKLIAKGQSVFISKTIKMICGN